jgi:diguanylate cyclase (GGDEF)-like protein
MVRKNGSIRFVEAAISQLKNKQDEVIGFRCVSRDVTERKQMEQLLADMATHDFLTELPNRVLLIDRFAVALAQAQRKEYKLAIMSLDLDRFKDVNDTMGHSVGDEVLKQVARKLAETVRSSDTVARLGGDEFLLLLQEIHDLKDATTIADKIVNSLKEPLTIEGHVFYLSASIGIAICPDDGNDLEALMKKSDASMYYSKRHGGSQYRVHSVGDRIEFNC